MKFKAKNLYAEIAQKRMKVVKFTEEMNRLQRAIDPNQREITPNSIYLWDRRVARPSNEKTYIIAAILGKHPSKLFEPEYDDVKYQKYLDLWKEICYNDCESGK